MANIVADALFYIVAYITLFFSVLWLWMYFTSPKKEVKPAVRPLSMVIPVYNHGRSIRTCINSLLRQGYPNLRIIVVNDGSTDNTEDVVKPICRKHRNVEYIGKKNGGKASALNAGLKRVKTELFGFVDADTRLSKGALKNMAGYISGNTAAVIATIKPDNPGNAVEKLQQIEYVLSAFIRKILTFIDSLYITPGFSIYRTGIVKKLGGFDENNITEDLEMGLKLKNNGYSIETSLHDYAYTKVPGTFSQLFRQRIRWYRGYIHNTKKYMGMMFNRKYGDFGAVVLPMTYMILAFTIPFIIMSIYDLLVAVVQRTIDLFIVNFDVKYLLSTYSLNVITPTTFFLLLTFITFFLMISLSKKSTNEKISRIDYVLFMAVYPFVNLFLWISALIYELTRAKRRW